MFLRFAICAQILVVMAGVALPSLGHLCDVDGPVMGDDCCCKSAQDAQRADETEPELGLPACCDSADILGPYAALTASSANSEAPAVATAPPLPSAARFLGLCDATQSLPGPAPPDSAPRKIFLRNRSLLI